MLKSGVAPLPPPGRGRLVRRMAGIDEQQQRNFPCRQVVRDKGYHVVKVSSRRPSHTAEVLKNSSCIESPYCCGI